jgi:hypothetical protein
MTLRHTIAGTNYDSVLEPASGNGPARLTVVLKIGLVPLDPTAAGAQAQPVKLKPGPAHLVQTAATAHIGPTVDVNGTPVSCRSWTQSEWNAFQIRFKRVVEHSWNDQIVLLPLDDADPKDVLDNLDYRQFIGDRRIRAHAEGALRIELMPQGRAGHAMIEVVCRADPAASFRDQMSRISDRSVFFRQHHDARWPGAFFGQAAAAHEVGHWLTDLVNPFFRHVDADFARALTQRAGETQAQFRRRRDRDQYGHTLGKRSSLMGAGAVVSDYEAAPWLTQLRRHTQKLGWSFMHRLDFHSVEKQLTPRQNRLP